MTLKLTVHSDSYKSPYEIIEEGQQAQLLQEHPIFQKAINEMYNQLSLKQDLLLGESDMDDRLMNQKLKNLAMTRVLISDLIQMLDYFITNAELERDNLEPKE